MQHLSIEQQAEDIMVTEWRYLERGGEGGSTQPFYADGSPHPDPTDFALWIAPPDSWRRAGRLTLLPCQVYQRLTSQPDYTFLSEFANTMQAMQYVERLTGAIVTVHEGHKNADRSEWFTLTWRRHGYPPPFSP